jgi:malonyl-CoA O-methyltransferase
MSPAKPFKNPVRQSFNRAATSYSDSASLQRSVADALITALQQSLPRDFNGRILDAGCGTGYCIEKLHHYFPSADLIGLDFADDMLRQLPETNQRQCINAHLEHLPLAAGSIDCYISNLAWQWCDPVTAAQESHRTLHPQGQLIISTLSTGTFKELAHCLQQLELPRQDHLLEFMTPDRLIEAFDQAGWHVADLDRTTRMTWHRDFRSLRHSIRGVGANHLPSRQTTPLNRSQRSALISTYESLRTPQGLPLSYDVVMLRALKTT